MRLLVQLHQLDAAGPPFDRHFVAGFEQDAGDVAMLGSEITPVLKTLRSNGLDVVAIHHHMTTGQPTVYFLHYWGTGPADKLASAFKDTLGVLGKGGHGAGGIH